MLKLTSKRNPEKAAKNLDKFFFSDTINEGGGNDLLVSPLTPRRAESCVEAVLPDNNAKQELKDESDIKVFAKKTMNELLGLYGYDRVAESDFKKFTSTVYLSSPPSSHTGSETPELTPTASNEHSEKDVHLLQTSNPQNENGNFKLLVSTVSSEASTGLKKAVLCSWCRQQSTPALTFQERDVLKSFCSEKCFAACRRAKFKKTRACSWCKQMRQVLEYLDEENGERRLQFCSTDCLENYKMTLFCSELRTTKESEETSPKAFVGEVRSKLNNLKGRRKADGGDAQPGVCCPKQEKAYGKKSVRSDVLSRQRFSQKRGRCLGNEKCFSSKMTSGEATATLQSSPGKHENNETQTRTRKRTPPNRCHESTCSTKRSLNEAAFNVKLAGPAADVLRSGVTMPNPFIWSQIHQSGKHSEQSAPESEQATDVAVRTHLHRHPFNFTATDSRPSVNETNFNVLESSANTDFFPKILPTSSLLYSNFLRAHGPGSERRESLSSTEVPATKKLDERSFALGMIAARTNHNNLYTNLTSGGAETLATGQGASCDAPSNNNQMHSYSATVCDPNKLGFTKRLKNRMSPGDVFNNHSTESCERTVFQTSSQFLSPVLLIPLPVPVPLPIPIPLPVLNKTKENPDQGFFTNSERADNKLQGDNIVMSANNAQVFSGDEPGHLTKLDESRQHESLNASIRDQRATHACQRSDCDDAIDLSVKSRCVRVREKECNGRKAKRRYCEKIELKAEHDVEKKTTAASSCPKKKKSTA